LAVEKDRATLALLNSQTQSEQDILAIEKERLAQLSSVNDVTKDQLTLLQDQFAASSAYTALTTQLKVISLEQAQVQLEVLQQTNVAAQAQLDIQNNALNVEQGKLALLEAQLKLSQDQTLASPQYLALGAQLNQLKVVQDSLSIAGLKNNALDREVTFLENQQKLLVTQNTERNTSLQQQKDIQQVAVDQLTLATQQTQQQITQVGQLQAQLLVLGNQADQLRQQQTILTDINAIQLDSLTQAEAGAKVLEDQLTLQIAQNSVITSHQAMLTLQVQYLDRQNAQLTAQQSVTTSINALALDNLTRQQATAKVQTDQLTLQQAQLNVITEATAKITLEIAAYEKESAQLDAQKKLLTDQNTLAQDSLVKQQATQKVVSDTLAIQVAQVQAQQAEANGVDATLTKLNAELQLRQAIVKVQTTAAVQQQQQQPTTQGTFGPSSQVLNPPSQPPTQGPALIPSTTYSPYGPLITGGQYAGFTIIHQVNVNIGGRTVTQLVLEDMHTGQTLDVNIP
jgi:hypothetical protein